MVAMLSNMGIAHAASNSLQLNPSQTSITNGSEVQLTVKTNTSTAIVGVQVTITYDTKYLKFLSFSDAAAPFNYIWLQGDFDNTLKTTRSNKGGSKFTGQQTVFVAKFKALANTSGTTITSSGRAYANSEVGLDGSSTKLAIATPTTPPPTTKPGGSTTGTSGSTGSGNSSTGNTANGISADGSATDSSTGSADGTNNSGDSIASNSGGVAGVLGSVKSIERHKPLLLLFIAGLLALFGVGTWLWLRRRKRLKHSTQLTEPVGDADITSPIVASTATDYSGSNWMPTQPALPASPASVLPQASAEVNTESFSPAAPQTATAIQPVSTVFEPQVVQPSVSQTSAPAAAQTAVVPENSTVAPQAAISPQSNARP